MFWKSFLKKIMIPKPGMLKLSACQFKWKESIKSSKYTRRMMKMKKMSFFRFSDYFFLLSIEWHVRLHNETTDFGYYEIASFPSWKELTMSPLCITESCTFSWFLIFFLVDFASLLLVIPINCFRIWITRLSYIQMSKTQLTKIKINRLSVRLNRENKNNLKLYIVHNMNLNVHQFQ